MATRPNRPQPPSSRSPLTGPHNQTPRPSRIGSFRTTRSPRSSTASCGWAARPQPRARRPDARVGWVKRLAPEHVVDVFVYVVVLNVVAQFAPQVITET